MINLENIILQKEGKEATKRKNAFSIQTRSGAIWLIQPQVEADISEWMTTISEAIKEACSPQEVSLYFP